ncbi:hypothetical protein GCM10027521_55590 [Amycolatopsis cihanbeyliensis]
MAADGELGEREVAGVPDGAHDGSGLAGTQRGAHPGITYGVVGHRRPLYRLAPGNQPAYSALSARTRDSCQLDKAAGQPGTTAAACHRLVVLWVRVGRRWPGQSGKGT